ncbi:MAG: ABC transporter substrate-binding protein [Mycobacterium leprae]
MKRIVTAAVAAVLAVGLLAGCGAKPAPSDNKTQAQSTTPTLDKIKKDGKLVIGTSPDYPPFESLDNSNNVIGFDIDIMNAVAQKLGVKLEIVQMDFGGLLPALTTGNKFQIMAAGVSVTDERKKAVDFTVPYVTGNNAVVENVNTPFPVTKLEDLTGHKVGAQVGTVQADALKKINGVTVKEYNLFTDAAQAVSAKQADAMYISADVAKNMASHDKNLKVVLEVPSDPTAYALRKDESDLTTFVSQVITDLQKSGQMDQLVAKWFK